MLAALALTPLLLPRAEAVSVFWLTQQTLFSQETEGGPTYMLKARLVNGVMRVGEPTTYSLNFKGGGVRVGGQPLKPGCQTGPLKAGTLMSFQGAREVELHLPARPCPKP